MFRLKLPRFRVSASKCVRPSSTVKESNPLTLFVPSYRSLSSHEGCKSFTKDEIRACVNIFKKSGLLDTSSPKFYRFWSSTFSNVSACQFHSASSLLCHNSPEGDKEKKEEKQKKENGIPLLHP